MECMQMKQNKGRGLSATEMVELYIEAEVHDIAFLHDVLLALEA